MTFDQKLMATRLFFTVYYFSTELSAELTYCIETFLLSATDTKACTGTVLHKSLPFTFIALRWNPGDVYQKTNEQKK